MWMFLAALALAEPLDSPAITGRTASSGAVVATVVGEGPTAAVEVVRAGGEPARLLTGRWRPSHLALSADGRWLGFVSGRTGWASVYVVDTRGGEPRQLTNVGLEQLPRTPGRAPPGFVPPPMRELVFDGDRLVWSGPEQTWTVRWTP